jgi:hypothetical protein
LGLAQQPIDLLDFTAITFLLFPVGFTALVKLVDNGQIDHGDTSLERHTACAHYNEHAAASKRQE